MQPFGDAEIGVSTFYASRYANDQCGADGLPLTPSSIKIVGRFQELRVLHHPRLCQYLDAVRGKHERLIIVAEHYSNNLGLEAKKGTFKDPGRILPIIHQTLEGLSFMHKYGLVHRGLSPSNILLNPEGHVKLAKFGLYHITNCGSDVPFPIGHPRYMAPEVLTPGPMLPTNGDTPTMPLPPKTTNLSSGPKGDVWSLGMVILELCLGQTLWPVATLPQILAKVMLLGKHGAQNHPLDTILDEHAGRQKLDAYPASLQSFLRKCLSASPLERPSTTELLEGDMLKDMKPSELLPPSSLTMFRYQGLRCKDLELDTDQDDASQEDDEDHMAQRPMKEVYYLWTLAGGDLEGELRKKGLLRSQPPLCALANIVTDDGDMHGKERDTSSLNDDTVVILSLEQLKKRLENIEEEAYYPLLGDDPNEGLPTSQSSSDLSQGASLPLVIRERDIEYQFHRVVLFDRLLKGYPFTIGRIWKEARIDIPTMYRDETWAALLGVEGDIQANYDAIDKETPTAMDRQIEVDIPRCHQYNELLSSVVAHNKFKRILKAWVVSHPELTYWQGLDSLCAPFLYLNFSNEALAYACLKAFIPKYLYKFFMKDNSLVIQEYLAVFSHMIAFHDPELSNHLQSIGFIPELFAIPWFLTMFSHVFPLHKIFHLWDTLLLGTSSFPLCIGVAILQQLRVGLLMAGFNECILLFSDMPEIDIEKCVRESIRLFCNTPKSATYRKYAHPPKKVDRITATSQIKPVSYYSTDSNDMPRSELSREALSQKDLKEEVAPRISAEDLLELCDLHGSNSSHSPTKKNKNSKPIILIVDIRSSDDFSRGHIPSSVNTPFNSAFSPEGDLIPCPAVTQLYNHRGRVVTVVGHKGKNAPNFARELVKLGFSKVCVMHGGIDCLRSTGLLTVSSPDL
ncbi:TBC domain-containing protein kinase-like protein [Strongylocentrotus purpuratus]|uniref:TBC domain-containing protein kinase-like protein n=1 Tax=Strongylocentrotus purpuratus TaxID=7668 RepID=A0A7M7NHT3_STRPU|nr:TBC domain-containing protein kinase-like protein [Strongylocentrotus purpuratus]